MAEFFIEQFYSTCAWVIQLSATCLVGFLSSDIYNVRSWNNCFKITLRWNTNHLFVFIPCTSGVSASSGSIEMWASLIIGLVVGLISSVVSWSIQKYQPLWTSTAAHDITYTHGIPGVLGAVAGKTTLARDRSRKCVFKSIRFHLNKNEANFFDHASTFVLFSLALTNLFSFENA